MDWEDTFIPYFQTVEGENFKPNNFKITIFFTVILIIFFVIFLRIFHLQITEGTYNRQLADGNRIQVRIIHAPRGIIFDRNGVILARNDPGFKLGTNFISRDEVLKMEIKQDPKFKDLEIDNIRVYPFKEITAHLLGYVGEINQMELKTPKFKDYNQGNLIGRGGVEEAYESFLRGKDGGEVIEVDAKGRKLRSLRTVEAIPGNNLYLTIDSDLEKQVFNQLVMAVKKVGVCCAAAVVTDPQSGQILSMVSLPSYDPQNINDYLNAEDFPILNRAIAGLYPPGSTFKIASSLAGLSMGKITAQTSFEDTGVVNLGPYTFTNWYFTQYGKLEGSVNLVKALQRSNDTYFYHLAQLTGEKILQDTARKLGFGKKVGIDIPGEVDGLIPDNEWKLKTTGQIWFPGDTLHMAIGQGFVLTTPLQISNLTVTVASLGKIYPSHLGLKITNAEGKLMKEFRFNESKEKWKKEDLELVKKGLKEVTRQGGTAWPFFNFPIESAGKTGTAEFGDLAGKIHAWYTGFAPSDDPKIAVTVLVEGGGEGSSVAAPVVKEIMRWFFSPDKNNLIKDLGEVASDSAKTLGE